MRIDFRLLGAICLLWLPTLVWAKPTVLPGWDSWRVHYVNQDGRVVDTGQGSISHSEGQGIALFLAAAAGDRATFERVWNWTHGHLQIRNDALFAWRWDPQQNRVSDSNNASDGDLLIAWGLVRGAERFHVPGWRNEARKVLADVRGTLLRTVDDGLVILPGETGFELPAGRVLNLSYWIFPAFPEFAEVDPSPDWMRLRDTGLSYLAKVRLGRWGLPPDWLLDVSPVTSAPGFKSRFGYDAVRIPLYLKWAGLDTPERMSAFKSYWHYFDGAHFVPAWTNLDDNSVDTFNAAPGILSVRNWVLGAPLMPPTPVAGEDYYSAALRMLTWIAAQSAGHS
jgi:endo-1,4-beta-D-glucanase Y